MRKQPIPYVARYLAGRFGSAADFLSGLANAREASYKVPSQADLFLNGRLPYPAATVQKRLQAGIAFHTSEAMLRRHEMANWQNTDSDIRRFAAYFVEILRKQGAPFYVHSAFRTQDEQQRLLIAGRSKANWPRAPHCQGAAVDIVHGAYHWELRPDEWARLGTIGKRLAADLNIDITWGGDWRFYDPAHWELTHWRNSIRNTFTGEPLRMTPRALLKAV